MSQESYRVGEHTKIRRPDKEQISKPDADAISHKEKGPAPALTHHAEFAQENNQHDGAAPFVKLRHPKEDVVSEKGEYPFLLKR